ncbi:MAG TPA: hypothetical protein H9985_10005 [Candidatus Anaerofilum faecale]|nr:hypothetical protein [Candidatus Anaerofilum faecale]
MKKRTRCAALLLAASLLAGCAPTASSALPEQVGGWVETDITPEDLSADAYDRDIFTGGDTIRIVEKTKDSVILHTSTDRGDSWQRTVPEWAQLPEGAEEAHFALSAEGAVYLKASVGVPQEGSDHLLLEDRLYVWQDGWQQIPVSDLLPITLPDDVPDQIADIQFDGEDLMICRGMMAESFTLLCADGSTRSYTTEDAAHMFASPLVARNGYVWGVNENDQIFTVDITGGVCYTQPAEGQMLMDVRDGNLYGLRGNSVYVRTENGTVWEQILDAENAPRMQVASAVTAVRALASDCLVADAWVSLSVLHGAGTRSQLLRYDYDPALVRPETRTLTVYSLEENPTVRQTVSQCMLEHPELEVRYEVGMQEGLEKEDVIKQLNTRLLAGEAPDVLILDGLPVDSMVEQGLLADLSSLVDTDRLYPAARAGERDGKLWYVAGRMKLPLLLGAGYEPPESLEQLAQAVENGPQLHTQSTLSDRAVLGQPPEEIAAVLLPGMRDKLLQDGQIDRAALEEFYTLVGRLCSAAGPEIYEQFWRSEQMEEKFGSSWIDGVTFFPQDAAAQLKTLDSLNELCFAFYYKEADDAVDLGQYCVRGVPGAQGVYVPSVMAGIPAGQEETADAAIFLEKLLSHPVQQYEMDDGLPVRPESLQSQWELEPMREYLPHADDLLPPLESLLAAADTAAVPDYFDEVVLEAAGQDLPAAEAADQVCEQLQTWLAEQN